MIVSSGCDGLQRFFKKLHCGIGGKQFHRGVKVNSGLHASKRVRDPLQIRTT